MTNYIFIRILIKFYLMERGTPYVGRHSRATPCRPPRGVRDRGRHPAARAARARMGFNRGPNGFQPRPDWVSTAIGIACGSYRPRLGRAKINSAGINSAGINSIVIVSGWSLDRGLVGASWAPGLSARAAASRRSSRPASSAYRPRPAGFQRSPPARRRGRRAAPRRGRAARPRPGGGS